MRPAHVQVILERDMSQEKLIKKFFKKCKNEDIVREYLDKTSFYLTKSQKEKEKQRKNKFLRQRKQR